MEYNSGKSLQMQIQPKYRNFMAWLEENGAITDKVTKNNVEALN